MRNAQTDALPGPQAGRSFAGREKEVNRYYASRPGPAGRVNRSDHTASHGHGPARRSAIRAVPFERAVRMRRRDPADPAGLAPPAYFRAPRSAVTAACSDSGVATDAGIGSPTASVSRLITPRLIGRGIRASECREK